MEFDIKNFLSGIVDGINDIFNELFQIVIMLLPTSPFKNITINPIIIDFLGYLNYYMPIKSLLIIMAEWLGCIVIYYTYQLVLRQIKAVS